MTYSVGLGFKLYTHSLQSIPEYSQGEWGLFVKLFVSINKEAVVLGLNLISLGVGTLGSLYTYAHAGRIRHFSAQKPTHKRHMPMPNKPGQKAS